MLRRSLIFASRTRAASVVVLAMLGTACSAASHIAKSPLVPANNVTATYVLTMTALPHCKVGDGVTVLKNTGSVPVRVTAVSAVIKGLAKTSNPHFATRAYQINTGSSGELDNTFALAKLAPDRPMRDLPVTFGPVLTTKHWYVVAVDISLHGNQPKPWRITGIKVQYSVGHHQYQTLYKQIVHLPAASCAPKSSDV